MPNSILPASWDVPSKFRERLGAKVGRQRAMFFEGHLLLVMHALPDPDQNEREGRFFWRKPDGTWISDHCGAGPGAVSKHLDQYSERIETLDRNEETATLANDYFELLQELTPLQRAARNMHTVLQNARKEFPDVREIIDYRDRAYELERSTDLLMTGTNHGLEYARAKQAEEQTKSSEKMAIAAHRLNILAAFFFPLATLTAIFGMDLQHGISEMAEVSEQYLFVGVIAAGLVAGIVLTLFVRVSRAR